MSVTVDDRPVAASGSPSISSACAASPGARRCASCISASASSRRWCGRWCGCSSSPPDSARSSACRSFRRTDLRSVRGLCHARTDGDDPVVQRHAVLAVDGLRPRDGQHAHAAGEPVPALVPADRQTAGKHRGVDRAGLRLSGRRLVLGRRAAGLGLSRRASRARADRHDARLARDAAVLGHSPAREFRRRDELRDLPDVLRLVRAVPAVAGAAVEPGRLHDLPAQSVHLCRRTDPLRAVHEDRLDLARGRACHDDCVHDRRDRRL